MGLGPSIKMTTLHHFNCPVTRALLQDSEIEFENVIVSGVPDLYDDKMKAAAEAGELAGSLRLDGAVVAIDGWGNHHVDFIAVIEQLLGRNIPVVGLSFLGKQGKLVCGSDMESLVVDFNKSLAGFETCVVGQNCLTADDAYRAIVKLKRNLKPPFHGGIAARNSLDRICIGAADMVMTDHTVYSTESGVLSICSDAAREKIAELKRLRRVEIKILTPEMRGQFVNSNLDFMPIAKKLSGNIGSGTTLFLSGMCAMLTGVEEDSGYQPANIGSSQGILREQVAFGRPGTPKCGDKILHVDVLFREGEGRTAEGIAEAHMAADFILDEIRACLPDSADGLGADTECFETSGFPGNPRIGLVKLVSCLGNMYDTSLFPDQPGGYLGSTLIRTANNYATLLTPQEVLDGAIHSLL